MNANYWGIFHNFLDLDVYRHGGSFVVQRLPLYDGPVLQGMMFTYTPFAGILFTVWAVLTFQQAIVVWSALNVVALFAVVVLCWKYLGYRLDVKAYAVSALATTIFLFMEPIRTTLWLGQINIFLLLLIVWDLGRDEKSRLRGIGAGIAAGVKLTPAFFWAYLFITRQWRALVTAVVTFAATVAIGFVVIYNDAYKYWTGTLVDSERVGPTDAPSNQSVSGLIAQLTHTPTPSRVLVLVFSALAVCLGLGAAWIAHRHGQKLLGLTMTGLTATTVSPFSWGHHWGVVRPAGRPRRALRDGVEEALGVGGAVRFPAPGLELVSHLVGPVGHSGYGSLHRNGPVHVRAARVSADSDRRRLPLGLHACRGLDVGSVRLEEVEDSGPGRVGAGHNCRLTWQYRTHGTSTEPCR